MLMNSYDSLPEVKLIALNCVSFKSSPPQQKQARSVKIQTAPSDIRQTKVREFLNSNNLAPNSRKSYERELNRFLAWTELLWGEIKTYSRTKDILQFG